MSQNFISSSAILSKSKFFGHLNAISCTLLQLQSLFESTKIKKSSIWDNSNPKNLQAESAAKILALNTVIQENNFTLYLLTISGFFSTTRHQASFQSLLHTSYPKTFAPSNFHNDLPPPSRYQKAPTLIQNKKQHSILEKFKSKEHAARIRYENLSL